MFRFCESHIVGAIHETVTVYFVIRSVKGLSDPVKFFWVITKLFVADLKSFSQNRYSVSIRSSRISCAGVSSRCTVITGTKTPCSMNSKLILLLVFRLWSICANTRSAGTPHNCLLIMTSFFVSGRWVVPHANPVAATSWRRWPLPMPNGFPASDCIRTQPVVLRQLSLVQVQPANPPG